MHFQALKQTVSSGLLSFPITDSMRLATSSRIPTPNVWNGLRLMVPRRCLSVAGRAKGFR